MAKKNNEFLMEVGALTLLLVSILFNVFQVAVLTNNEIVPLLAIKSFTFTVLYFLLFYFGELSKFRVRNGSQEVPMSAMMRHILIAAVVVPSISISSVFFQNLFIFNYFETYIFISTVYFIFEYSKDFTTIYILKEVNKEEEN